MTSTNTPATSQPGLRFTQLLSSRRMRIGLLTSSVFLILLVHVHSYDALSMVPSWERPHSNDVVEEQQEPKQQEPTPATHVNTRPSPSTHVVQQSGHDTVDWSRFAYTQYVTNSNYLCNSVMLFEVLHKLGSQADRLMMYPSKMLVDPTAKEATAGDGRLIIKARDEYNVKLVPITVQSRPTNDATWAESFTKLLAFNQTQYDRVLSLDSDSIVLQSMDELFLLPPCPVAMPRAYWLYPDKKILSSQLVLIQPSTIEFDRIMKRISDAKGDDYDMEIVNYLYMDSALILPHRPYDMLTAEFRRDRNDHVRYLGTDVEEWDPVSIYNEAKFLHFSDWPMPKPWLHAPERIRKEKEPKCHKVMVDGKEEESCIERDLWNGFYNEFKERRERVCKVGKTSRRNRFRRRV